MNGKSLKQAIKQLIALNILYIPHNIEEIRHAYISKHNL